MEDPEEIETVAPCRRVIMLDFESELIHIFHENVLMVDQPKDIHSVVMIDRVCACYPSNYYRPLDSNLSQILRSPKLIMLNSVDAVYYEVP